MTTAIAGSADDVCQAVRGVRERGRVLPVAGATKPALSTPVGDGTLALDVSSLRGIREYDPAELTITAQAATPVTEIAAALAEHGQHLPFDPVLATAGATIGGAVACGAAGPGAHRHGGIRDFVIGVRIVDGTGRLVTGGGKVVKNAAGFDLPKLMVGSLGSLGVIVELSLKVFPRPRATITHRTATGGHGAATALMTALLGFPFEFEALDVTPEGDVLTRIGGEPGALEARGSRVRAVLAGAAGGAEVTRIDGADEAALWRDAADMAWVPQDATLVRVPCTLRSAPALTAAAHSEGAAVRLSLGANIAWLAWPAGDVAADALDTTLRAQSLTGVVLTGPPGRPLPGRRTGGEFGARVRRAIDPYNCFAEV